MCAGRRPSAQVSWPCCRHCSSVVDVQTPTRITRWACSLWNDWSARGTVASLLNADVEKIVFNSGSSEGCAQVFHDFFERYKHERPVVIHSAIEHACTLENIKRYRHAGLDAWPIGHYADGRLDMDCLTAALEKNAHRPILACVMSAHNETGVIQPVDKISDLVQGHGGLMYSDMTQSVGKVPVNLRSSKVDYAIGSGHKFGALPGVGMLYVKDVARLSPLIPGGGQEGGRRGGTQNYPGILSIETALQEKHARFADREGSADLYRAYFERSIRERIVGAHVVGEDSPRVPCVSFLCLPGVNTKKLQLCLSMEGIHVSGGSACSDRKKPMSNTVVHLGFSEAMARSAIRISIDEKNCQRVYERILDAITRALKI